MMTTTKTTTSVPTTTITTTTGEDQTTQQVRHPYYDEKAGEREARIRSLFDSLDRHGTGVLDADCILGGFLKLTHLPAHTRYATDLLAMCDTARDGLIDYGEFRAYVLEKEKDLWSLFAEINKSGDNRLHPNELEYALKSAGIRVTKEEIEDFIHVIDTEGNGYIDFQDWRDFLLLLPRETTITEIYRYYQTSTQLTHDAEVVFPHTDEAARNAYKYLAAGGIAGAVSRTCTAPFDRLKVYLITQTSYHAKSTAAAAAASSTSTAVTSRSTSSSIVSAVRSIYSQGGFRAFFVGNGLNVFKIVPESSIKFYVFETAKTVLAELTHSEDKNAIPVGARFIAGGVAGLCSQFCIYPVETLKTRIMSTSVGSSSSSSSTTAVQTASTAKKSLVLNTAKQMYRSQGIRSFWPGLTLGLMGVFPYQALDMGIYETLKVTYLQYMKAQSTGRVGEQAPQPNILVLWSCGMVSGCIGATSVYPLNMIRTRLQAQGTPGHPYTYTSAWDAAKKTYQIDGVKGFYRGLGPTLFKVVPSVSISYAVYEMSKRSLGIS
ncbi:mitochondrial carrier domain-containing protein [Halteromyces radiatus]|uniref:mitochondrial carrier domain-containing protein n=1 Tax=Halteromyces radiatus TaxID=101107 RepID=UPI0022210E18|nr:mitochondrial carrier domain-containing protein [Halteromyces radiatus]KAI8077712.1 mitochondrial carrier domain-containing protein [Halteromyces radiatus]